MGEVITGYGEEAGLCGHDGSVWIKVKVDADGHLQVDGISVALPTNAATATNQTTMITALQLIDDLRNALGSVNTDDLQVDVKTSGLPTGAATSTNQSTIITALQNLLTELALKADLTETQPVSAASLPLPTGAATATNQATMITALQLIDDLRNALGSVATDSLLARLYGWDTTAWQKVRTDVDGYTLVRVWSSELPDDAATQTTLALLLTELQAKLETADLNLDASKDLQVDVKTMPTVTVQAGGSDKIFSFESIAEGSVSELNLPAGISSIMGTAVGTGKIWMITTVAIIYAGTTATAVQGTAMGLASNLPIIRQNSPTAWVPYFFVGELYLQAGDYLQASVWGATAGDDLYLHYAGVQMDAPA